MIKISKFVIIFFIVASIAISPLAGVQAQSASVNRLSPSAAVVTPTTIAPTGIITDTTPTFTWSKITGATRYQYYLYKGTALVYTKAVAISACGVTTCSNTPTNVLGYASNYKWRILAFVGGSWKTPSAYRNFSLVTAQSLIPVPTAPAGTITGTTPTFTWSKITGATQYQYYLYKGTVSVYTKVVAASVCGTSTCSNTPTTILGYASTYKWRVRALVSGIWRTSSVWKAFNLISLIPIPITPTGIITDDTPTFTWSKIAVASQYQYSLYKGTVQVYMYNVASSSACGVSTCSATPTAKYLTSGAYNWKVRAQISGIWRGLSGAKSFTLNAPATVPTPYRPVGTTYGSTPSFQWTKVTGATAYQYNLYANGTTLVYTKTIAASACGSLYYCSYTPTETLSSGTSYTWYIRAYIGGIWRAMSSSKIFNIVLTGSAFSSSFNANTLGWTPVWGLWQLNASAYYITPGVVNTFSSIKHDNQYATMTYEARMERLGTCTECGSYLLIRGVESPITGSNKSWYDSLLFQYSNNGYFSVLQTNNGAPSRFVDWTGTTAVISKSWNVLKVVANYNYMMFYINNKLVWSGTIPTAEPVGQVGIGMFSTGIAGDTFYLDSVTLTTTAAAASSTDIAAESSQAQMHEVTGTDGTSSFGVSP